MRLRSRVMLVMLSAAFPGAFANPASSGVQANAWVRDSLGKPVLSSSGECWHSSLPAPQGAPIAAGCRAPATDSVAAARTAESTPPPRAETAQAAGARAAPPAQPAMATGASTPASQDSGGSGAPAYVTDSRGIVVRGSSGDCWRTGSWTPAQATVVGCDVLLSRALPVPAPAQPGRAGAAPTAPSAQPSAPGAVSPSEAPPLMPPVPPSPPSQAVPPATAAPGGAPPLPMPPAPTPPATLAPEDTQAAPAEPSAEKVTFDTDTFFDFDKSMLKPAGRAKLDALASRLSQATVEVVVAVGHADATGTKDYNQRLSERRARAVVNYLADKGLPQEKIFSEGKGETQPAASNATKAGRAKNRRVEVEVVATRSRK